MSDITSSMFTPTVSISRAKVRREAGLAKRKWPVSVSIPAQRPMAISRLIGLPARSMTSRTTSAQLRLLSSHRYVPRSAHLSVGQ
ncbi:MAG TPA: hypothetical protein HA343_00070 [Methanomassiliicoccales archaeon]|nr:hypothetical protein [Methanomassiliicoccales archaeon]